MAVRVLVCNTIHLYAEGLRRLLEENQGILVSGVVYEELTSQALEAINPDLVIADPASFTKVAGHAKKILLISDSHLSPSAPQFSDLRKMVEQGLVGIIDAQTTPELLHKAVTKTVSGELWIDHQFIHNSLCTNMHHPEVVLSQREAEVLHYVCEGDSNKEIASKLCISEKTVKTHCNHLFKKFGVSSRLRLARCVCSVTEEGSPPSLRVTS